MLRTRSSKLPLLPRWIDAGGGICQARSEPTTASQFDQMVNHESGLLGVSETNPELRDLLAQAVGDVQAAEAVALFCYPAKKWIGSYAAALGGLDPLIFAGGSGANAPRVRARIREVLSFLGTELNQSRNTETAGISTNASRATVRVVRTDDELMIARSVCRALGLGMASAKWNSDHATRNISRPDPFSAGGVRP